MWLFISVSCRLGGIMGYYSTVLVKCDDTAYTRIKEVFDKYKNEYPTHIQGVT